MLMVEIHEFASDEFNEAIRWCDSQSKGLGSRFEKAVVTQVGNIRRNPSWYPREEDDIYKVYIPKFLYQSSLYFRFEEGCRVGYRSFTQKAFVLEISEKLTVGSTRT